MSNLFRFNKNHIIKLQLYYRSKFRECETTDEMDKVAEELFKEADDDAIQEMLTSIYIIFKMRMLGLKKDTYNFKTEHAMQVQDNYAKKFDGILIQRELSKYDNADALFDSNYYLRN